MAADSTKGYGSTVQTSTTSGGTFTALAQVKDITPPNLTVDADDVKHMSSTGQFKDKEPGWIDSDNPSFDMLFTKAQFNTLIGYAAAGTKMWWKFIDPAGNYEKCEAFVSKVGRSIPMEGRIMCVIELTVTQLPTFTAV